MADIQTNESVERAKERLQELEGKKAAMEDPLRRPATDGDKPRSKSDLIRPTEQKPKKESLRR